MRARVIKYDCSETFTYLFYDHSKCDTLIADDGGKTALLYLYERDRLGVINDIIIRSNYDIISKTEACQVLLYSAVVEGHLSSFYYILHSMAKNFTDMFKHVLCMNTDEVKNTALHLACIYGRIETVRYIIGEVGLSPTITNKEGQTCFHLACKYGQLSIIQYLYSIDGNSLYRDHDGNTPLHIACQYGQLSIVEFISTTNSERVLDSYGRNPLHVACYYGHLEIVKFCVKNLNFDQFYRDHLGLTPLAHACVGNRLDVVCYLETNIAPIVDNTGYTPLHHVCRHGHLKIVQYLTLERKSRLFYRDHDNNIPLHVAACYNQTEVVDYFLKQNLYDSDHRGENGQTPLILAAFYESYETLKLLIDGYSNCDYSIADDSGKTAFWYIYNQGDIDIIKYYLNAFNCKIEGNYMKKALLHTAAEKGQYVAFKLICESMKNNPVMQISERILYETDDYGNTSLHLASKFGHLEVVKYLVENIKLNLNILNLDGQTCFHLACKYGQLSIMQYICSIDGNIFCRDHDGSTPLHIACHYGHLSIFKFISTTNSERVLDNNGRNPLHIACYYGHLEIVKFCVKNLNFDQFYRDHQGLTPLAHACAGNNRLDIVCYLETNSTPTVDNTGYTPLHHACKHGHLKIVQYLTIEKKSHVLYRDHDNNTPLHVAARHNQTEVVHYFFEQNMYDSDLRGENGRTPLHIAAAYNCGKTLKYLLHCSLYFDPWMEDGSGKSSFLYLFLAGINDIVLKIIRSAKYTIVCQTFETRVFLYLAAEPKHHQSFKHLLQHLTALRDIKKEIVLHQNTDDLGNTALHIACKFESFETVQYILDEIRFPSNTYNFDSQTCLHLASEHGHLSIVKYLTMNNKCDPLSGDQYGHMPLHYAVENGHLSVVKYFIEESRVNMEIRDEWSNTLLHLACTKGHTEIVEFLVNNSSKLLVYNIGGNTPLHLACLAGHYEIFRMLFTTTKYDIHVRNNLGKSIADYAQDKPDMAQTIREVYGVEATFIPKIFVIGFSGAGKSTLVSALQKEASFLGRYLTIPKVPPHTVGVTPVRFQSSSYGTVNLYDFAGHEEYHANHQLLFQSSYLPIVLLLVNLLMKEEDIIFCIKYWVNILRNSLASHASIKRGANIVILGSHYDKIHGDKKTKINNLEVKIEKIFSKWEEEDIKYSRGIICLDCRKPSSNGIEALRNLMHSSCLACRAKIAENCSYETSLICQEILVFLNKSVSFKLACTISDICRIARKEGLIPDRVKSDEEMFEICSTLGFYGKIMLLTNSDHQEDSWIILDEKYILSEFHSSMHLLQSKFNKSFSDQVSCGLVSKSQLQKLFPNNLGLILKYLQYSQICVEIEAESFSIIPQSLLTGCYYFFPYLTQENKPNLFILQSAEEMTPFYGWQVVCHDPFTPRFLQVLLVQLTVPVPGAGDEVQPNYKVWKNRIHIRNNDTTESIIEVTNPACQFIFATRCKKGGETNLLIRRSQLIHLILSVLERNCPLITYEEFVYEPQSSYPIDAYANKVSLKTVAGVLLEGRSTLATWDNQYLDLVTLLGHDPLLFLSIRTLKRIFLHPNDIIPQSIACEYQKSLKPFMKKEKFSTYKELHKCVHQYSIFSDRNIWVSTNPISTLVMVKCFFSSGYSWFKIKAIPSM